MFPLRPSFPFCVPSLPCGVGAVIDGFAQLYLEEEKEEKKKSVWCSLVLKIGHPAGRSRRKEESERTVEQELEARASACDSAIASSSSPFFR